MAFSQGAPIAKFGGIQVAPQYQTYRPVPLYIKQNPNVYYVANRLTPMPKVDPSLMINYWKDNMDFGHYTQYFARMMLRKFAEVAARYSPPNIGKANIENKYYYRPIYNMIEMSKGKVFTPKGKVLYPTKEDYEAIRKGMRFKVMNTKYRVRRGTVFAYTKGINEAKRLARIENRGLTKYSWGSILNTFNGQNVGKLVGDSKKQAGDIAYTRFGVQKEDKPGHFLKRRILVQTQLPVIFKRLQNKSPNIKKFRWGNVDWQEEDKPSNKITFTIKNNLAEVEKYCDIAIRRGVNAAVQEAQKLIKYIEADARDKIERMFNFDMDKVTKFTAFTVTTPAQRNSFKRRKKG